MATPVAVGTDVTANDNSVTAGEVTLDLAVTIHADADILVVGIGTQSSGRIPSAVTIDFTGNPSLTKLVDAQYTTSGNQHYASLWYITTDDANWATGAHTVSITPNAYSCTITAIARQYNNVDPTTPFSANSGADWGGAKSTPAETSLTSATDEVVVSCGAWYNVDPSSQSGTSIAYQDNDAAAQSFAMQDETGTAGSNTVGFTLASIAEWAVAAGSLQDAAGTTVSASFDALTITEYAASISGDKNVSANTDALAITTYQATIDTADFTAVPDTFDGTGALGSHWLNYNSSVQTVDRQSGYIEADVDDNTGGITLWFNTDQGRMDYQRVQFPTEALPNEYVFYNIGIGPTSDPRDDLSYTTDQFAFTGLIVHDANTANQDYMFSVIGHRGSFDQSTIEIKSTTSGTSYVSDEGTDVFGTGVTHGDLAVELRNDGSAKFKYKAVSASSWTYINAGTGLTPGTRPSLGSAGDEVLVGFIAYASGTIGIPWIGSADSFDAFEGTFKSTSLGITTYPATVNGERTVAASTDTLVITEYPATILKDIEVNTNLETLTLTPYQATIELTGNINTTPDSLIISTYGATITGIQGLTDLGLVNDCIVDCVTDLILDSIR